MFTRRDVVVLSYSVDRYHLSSIAGAVAGRNSRSTMEAP